MVGKNIVQGIIVGIEEQSKLDQTMTNLVKHRLFNL